MRIVPKFFNTAGPIQPDIHYNVDPLTRINLQELESLIYQQKYFVLHAPRQTGKTSCLLALRDYLNARGEFYAVYANVEAGQASRNNVEEVNRNVVSVIARETSLVVGSDRPSALRLEVLKEESATNLLGSYLDRLCGSLDRPLLLFIDEIDALVGDSLVSILRQLRAGYANRPVRFPQSIILCGVRDVRDYRIVLSNQDIITGGSAFNIKSESLRLGNFTREEIRTLYGQHTAATGQEFDESCFPMIWEATEGQPWLVNALGYEVTSNMKENRDRSIRIIPEMIYRAQERIIYRRDTHIDILIDKLREERVRRVIGPMLANEDGDVAEHLQDDDIQYVVDMGLIVRDKPLRIANAIYKESGPQLLLQAFLQRVVNGGGYIDREYGLGRGRTDLLIRKPLTEGYGGPVQRIVLELKIKRGDLEQVIAKGLEQTVGYIDHCGDVSEGHLIIFNRDPGTPWDEKIWHYDREYAGRTITVWGM